MAQTQTAPNRLIHESSLYLKQHAHNPVDWYPWSPEALQKAKDEDKPIFLSIGYSACHWCHVMEHESFEDPEVGKILSDHFVCIKVDREERPDVDQIYMSAVLSMHGHGGWPMSVFLTPDLKPFFGGTYYPPVDRPGLPSFRRVLNAVLEAWNERRSGVEEQADEITQRIQQSHQLDAAGAKLSEDLLRQASRHSSHNFDDTYGGFGQAPKFPHAMEIRLLLRLWYRFGDERALHMARKTLDCMAYGGIYDHLGGGFHRYSTDRYWLVPHFEKMLYDNGLLMSAYLDAYQITKSPLYRRVIEETLVYVQREMTSEDGPFFSTQDADSEGVEGKFFVWSLDEIKQILGDELSKLFCDVYNVSESGNWEGSNILHWERSIKEEAAALNMPVDELQTKLAEAKAKLLEVRNQRVWPGRDEKVLVSWNGLMISALAQAAQVFDHGEYRQAAERAADFILGKMRNEDGRLYRTWCAGSEPKYNGYLEDYSFFIDSLITLYETSFDPKWIEAATQLTQIMIDQFWDESEGGFFYTGRDHEQMIARTKDMQDSSIPSGNSMAATALLRLAKLTGKTEFEDKAVQTMESSLGLLVRAPQAASQMAIALDFHTASVDELAIVGDSEQPECKAALRSVQESYMPHCVSAFKSDDQSSERDELVPLLKDKTSDNGVTTYVCRNFTCEAPVEGVDSLKKLIADRTRNLPADAR